MAQKEKRKIVFMGTPEFARIALNCLCENKDNEIVGVFTRPDKKAGRGAKIIYSPVKEFALARNLPLFQPATLKSGEAPEQIAAMKPDFIVVAAYGLILPANVLTIPRVAPINIHGSLLPKYRGAAPIQRAIMNEWQSGITGVSIMRMVAGLDEGPVYARGEIDISNMDAGQLTTKMALLGGRLLCDALPAIESGSLVPEEQDHAGATYAAKLAKEDGIIDWQEPIKAIDARIRAVTPWPGASLEFTLTGHEEPAHLKIFPGKIAGRAEKRETGEIYLANKEVRVACEDGDYILIDVQPANKRKMTVREYVRGLRTGSGVIGKVANLK